MPGQNDANINSPGVTIDAEHSPTGHERLETDDILDNPESDDGQFSSAGSFGEDSESAFDDDIIEEEDEDQSSDAGAQKGNAEQARKIAKLTADNRILKE